MLNEYNGSAEVSMEKIRRNVYNNSYISNSVNDNFLKKIKCLNSLLCSFASYSAA